MLEGNHYFQGLVVGKFYPPHLGHKYLIDTALEQCDYVVVLIIESKDEKIPALQRKRWLHEMCPKAAIYIVDDIYDDDNSAAWAEHTKDWIDTYEGRKKVAVFTSEDYGETYAAALKITHVLVDKERVRYPICATDVRADVLAQFSWLHPVLRSHYTRRIVFVGAESTGTTTLSKYAAEQYHVPWVPEYGRMFCEAYPSMEEIPWNREIFAHIATQQNSMETVIACNSGGLIMCDTNAECTSLWEERYLWQDKSLWEDRALGIRHEAHSADLYVLTGDDIPFVQDGLRDGEGEIRSDMHKSFIGWLAQVEKPCVFVYGSVEERFAKIKPLIDDILAAPLVI
jgi:HTH-type transcriptional repressor of NAD biosynthesis genes